MNTKIKNQKSRIIIVVLFSILYTLTSMAQDYSQYYTDLPVELKQVQPVIIPETTVKITDFGGVGDGKALNTEAIAKAISTLSKQGGGHLVFPKGTWKTGPITLKSSIDIHLDKGATLLFSEDKSLYVTSGSNKCVPFIKGSKVQNVTITGAGTIDGQGIYWRPVKKVKASTKEWKEVLAMGGVVRDESDDKKAMWFPFDMNNGIPNIAETPEKQEAMRSHLINITDAENIMIQGVTLKNSPKFHFVPTRAKNVIIDGITVECPWNAQNGDALDLGNTQTAIVVNCNISCGDDGICMKGGVAEAGVKAGPNSDILIQNNKVLRAHGGFVIGSEFSGGMERIVVRKCSFDGTDVGLRFKSAPGRGGTCKHIYCMDIDMKNIEKEAIIFETGYADKGAVVSATANDDKTAFFPDFCNVAIYDVTVDRAKTAFKIQGLPGHPVHDIYLDNVIMKNCDHGIEFKYAENIQMTSSLFSSKKQNKIDEASCKNIMLNNVPMVK